MIPNTPTISPAMGGAIETAPACIEACHHLHKAPTGYSCWLFHTYLKEQGGRALRCAKCRKTTGMEAGK